MRRDGRFWGWIMGVPQINHLWREDNDTDPPRLLALCGHTPIEVGGVSRPKPEYCRADETTPRMQYRCRECDYEDWMLKRQRKDPYR